MKVKSLNGDLATVNLGGTGSTVSIVFLDDVTVGDYVLVHAGFAIKKIDEQEAAKTVELLNKMAGIVGDNTK